MRPLLLSVTAVGMIVSSAWAPFDGSGFGPGRDVTPPGVFFAIWGLIIALCLAVAAVSWRFDRTAVFDAAGWPLVLAQVGFSVWLLVASAATGPATVVVFVAILAPLLWALARLRGAGSGWVERLVAAAVGAYAGWSSAAIWLNVITTAPGRLGDSPAFQAAALAGGALTAVVVIARLRPSVAYPIAVGWALLGVVLSAAAARAWLPLAVAAAGLVGVVLVYIVGARRVGSDDRP